MEYVLDYARGLNANDKVIYWCEHTLQNYLRKHEAPLVDIEHVIDYLIAVEVPKINQMSYPDALKKAEIWNKKLQKRAEKITESNKDTKVVLDFEDGFKIVQLVGESAYKREGYLMRHCVTSYYGRDVKVYSLRDKFNNPHCTLEHNKQIKGKGNGEIHPKYIGYVVKFLEFAGMKVRDSEMENLGYVKMDEYLPFLHKDNDFFKGKYWARNSQLLLKNGRKTKMPESLIYLFDILAWNDGGLSLEEFFNAIPPDVDLFKVVDEFKLWLLTDKDNGIKQWANAKTKKIIDEIVVLLKRRLSGRPVSEKEWQSLNSAAWSEVDSAEESTARFAAGVAETAASEPGSAERSAERAAELAGMAAGSAAWLERFAAGESAARMAGWSEVGSVARSGMWAIIESEIDSAAETAERAAKLKQYRAMSAKLFDVVKNAPTSLSVKTTTHMAVKSPMAKKATAKKPVKKGKKAVKKSKKGTTKK